MAELAVSNIQNLRMQILTNYFYSILWVLLQLWQFFFCDWQENAIAKSLGYVLSHVIALG
jgi:hypothetical protein